MKKILSVFVIVALLVTSLSPAFLVIAADAKAASGSEGEFTVYLEDAEIEAGSTSVDVELGWTGNNAENNPNGVQSTQLFVYYPAALTFAKFATSDAITANAWEVSDNEYPLSVEAIDAVGGAFADNAKAAFKAVGAEIPAASADAEYKFVQVMYENPEFTEDVAS